MSNGKFTKADLDRAIAELSMLQFFPSDPTTHAAIQALLAKMCPHREALRWLVDAMVNKVGKWHGPAELRGVLCWRYRPADGIEAMCSLAGFTAEDGERLSLEQHDDVKRLAAAPLSDEARRVVALIGGRTE